jgi:hypothetical protein
MKIYGIILRGIDQLEFPRHVSKTAIAIVKRFCRENPSERLGYQKDGILDIKKHRWERMQYKLYYMSLFSCLAWYSTNWKTI